jgi:hypothetical protein
MAKVMAYDEGKIIWWSRQTVQRRPDTGQADRFPLASGNGSYD